MGTFFNCLPDQLDKMLLANHLRHGFRFTNRLIDLGQLLGLGILGLLIGVERPQRPGLGVRTGQQHIVDSNPVWLAGGDTQQLIELLLSILESGLGLGDSDFLNPAGSSS